MHRCARFYALLLSATFLCSSGPAARGGAVFVTGHDPDFHAYQGGNTTGAQHIIQRALAFTTNNSVGRVLLVTDTRNPGGGYSDPRLGMTAAGVTYDVADNGAAGGSVLDLHTLNFSNYSAIVVASDYGGWLRQEELDILIARESQLINYLNSGGGLVAFAESGPPSPGLLLHNAFGYLPFLVTSVQRNENEVNNTVTSFGSSLGLTNADVNGNASHNVFTATGGLNVVDRDNQGQILSLAYSGLISVTGAVPEPSSLRLAMIGAVVGVVPFLRRWLPRRLTSKWPS